MVKFVNVSQNYGSFKALHELNFEIKEGTLLALLGPNGAGKSTTMNIMTGFRPPLEGDVYINDVNIFEEPEKAKSHIGYLAEIPPLYPELTVWEYLNFVGEMRGIVSSEIEQRVHEVLDLLKIQDRKDSLIKNLSKGLKQRVGIAQSILHKPKLLVLDEPTVGLEPSQLIEFRQVIKYLAKEIGMTVVISTHIMAEASELCDAVIIINEGKKIFDGSKEELLLKNAGSFMYELVVNEATRELIENIEAINFVEKVEVFNNKLTITSKEDSSNVILQEAIKSGVEVNSISPVKNSLEQMFLKLTVK